MPVPKILAFLILEILSELVLAGRNRDDVNNSAERALLLKEVAHRRQTRLQRCRRNAHFPFFQTIEELDFTPQSKLRNHSWTPTWARLCRERTLPDPAWKNRLGKGTLGRGHCLSCHPERLRGVIYQNMPYAWPW
jgi:hypothetical protein